MPLDQQKRFLMQDCCIKKLLVFSDLHLEHKPNWSLPESFPDYDVCITAGDIDGSPAESIRWLASNPGLRGKPVVLTPGNHEFYGNVLEDAIEEGRATAIETGVHFLNAASVTIDVVRFIGGTLWSDYTLHRNQELGMDAAKHGMNDHRFIKRRAIRPGTPGKFRLEPKEGHRTTYASGCTSRRNWLRHSTAPRSS